jgi:hypothetical protein
MIRVPFNANDRWAAPGQAAVNGRQRCCGLHGAICQTCGCRSTATSRSPGSCRLFSQAYCTPALAPGPRAAMLLAEWRCCADQSSVIQAVSTVNTGSVRTPLQPRANANVQVITWQRNKHWFFEVARLHVLPDWKQLLLARMQHRQQLPSCSTHQPRPAHLDRCRRHGTQPEPAMLPACALEDGSSSHSAAANRPPNCNASSTSSNRCRSHPAPTLYSQTAGTHRAAAPAPAQVTTRHNRAGSAPAPVVSTNHHHRQPPPSTASHRQSPPPAAARRPPRYLLSTALCSAITQSA